MLGCEDCGFDLVEVEDELFGEDVLDLRFEACLVGSGEGGEGGVCVGALGEEGGGWVGEGCGWVLGDGGLDAFDC